MRIQQDFVVKAGGGTSNPDPVIYCPANGYIPDPRTVNFPFVIPQASEDSIIFICNARSGNWSGVYCNVTRSQNIQGSFIKFELFDEAGNLINTYTTTSSSSQGILNFPTNDCYYTVKVTVQAGERIIRLTQSTGTPPDSNVLEGIIINAPYLTSLFRAFQFHRKIQAVEIRSTCNELTTMQYMFYYSGIRYFKFANSYPALTNLSWMFYWAEIEEIDISYVDFPVLQVVDRFAIVCKNLRSVKLPPSMPCATTFLQFITQCPRLQYVQFFTSLPESLTDMNYILGSTSYENDIIIPDIPNGVTSMFRSFNSNTFVKNIKFNGGHNALILDETCWGCTALETLETPRTMSENSTSPVDAVCTALRYFKGPDIGFSSFPGNAGLISITGNHFVNTAKPVTLSTNVITTLNVFNCPGLKCTNLLIGSTTTKFTVLTTAEIDWANSPFSHVTAPQLRISAAFSASELNRIMGLLPVVSAGQIMDIGYCDGYFACNHSIALSKGWTVRGYAIISTDEVTSIARNTAVGGGNISMDGGYTPTRGVCWAVSPTVPTIANPKTTGTGAGSFTGNMSSLAANTTYNVRAYATTTYGTVYGEVKTFTTLP
jgi:hypothetical protein